MIDHRLLASVELGAVRSRQGREVQSGTHNL